MNKSKTMHDHIRGWFPSEPTLLAHSRYRTLGHGIPFMLWWLAAAVAVGLAVAASLVVLGNLAGFTTIAAGAQLWYLETGLAAWCSAGLVAVYGYCRRVVGKAKYEQNDAPE